MNNEIQTKKDVYEIMLEKVRTDKEFFMKLANEPEKLVVELNITNPEVKEKMLSMNPEMLLEGLNTTSSCVLLTTFAGGNCH